MLCYPFCRLLPSFVHRGFPATLPTAPPAPNPLVGFPSTPPVAPCPSIPLGTTHDGCATLPTQLCLILVSHRHEPLGCFKDPPVPLHRHFYSSEPQRSLNSKHHQSFGGSEFPKDSTMHPCQVLLNCPPGLRFSPLAIVPNITRLDNCSLLCRASAPANKSHCLWMIVSMLSQRVVVRAFACARGCEWSMKRHRWKSMTRKGSMSLAWQCVPL